MGFAMSASVDRDAGRGPDPIRIVLRPIGSPLPLGFFAFGVGTTLFSALELGWIGVAQTRPLAMILLAFVVPLQFVAAILAYFTRDAAAATAIGLFGMTWAAVSVVTLTSPQVGATSTALGLFMMAVSVLMVLLGVSSIAGKPVFAIVLALATARFFVTGLYQWTGRHGLETTSGRLGIPLCLAAVYLGLALLLEDAQRHTVLPLGRRGPARVAVESHLGDQVRSIEREAGVRRQL
jgi:hypothetical protein